MTELLPIISAKAYKDIEQIRNWYDERSIETANRFLSELTLFINKAAKNPEHYKRVSPKVRRCLLKIFPYIVFFSEQKEGVIVLRIRHTKQRPLKQYR